MGVGAGDEVATQGFFWISTIGAIVRNRAIPVLVDSDDTLNLDPDDLARKVTDRTKVVLPVHMAGEPARIGRILEVGLERGVCALLDAVLEARLGKRPGPPRRG